MQSETPSEQAPSSSSSNPFFDWMRGLGIVRQPGWIGGVCTGIAARLGIDVIIVRGIVVVLALFGAPALLLYAAAWLLLPDSEDRIHLERLFHGEFTPPVIAVGVLFLLALLPLGIIWGGGDWGIGRAFSWAGPVFGSWGVSLWTLVVIGSIVWFVIWATRRSRGTSRPTVAVQTTPTVLSTAAATTDGPASTVPGPEAPTPPPTPDATDADALAAWKLQQAEWKREHDAWKAKQVESERAIARDRAAEVRRVRQAQSAERQREWAERNERTRSNPLYSLSAIGIALVAGAIVTLLLSADGWTLTAAIAGMATTLGALGLAVVVNGARGKRSGGASGLAVLVTIALVITSLFSWVSGPVIQNRPLDWSPSYSAGASSQRTVINGDAALDLTDYFDSVSLDRSEYHNGRVSLIVVNGDVEVLLPAEEFSQVRANSVNGSITSSSDAPGTRRGPFASADHRFDPRDSGATRHRDVFVQVWALNGNVTISQATR